MSSDGTRHKSSILLCLNSLFSRVPISLLLILNQHKNISSEKEAWDRMGKAHNFNPALGNFAVKNYSIPIGIINLREGHRQHSRNSAFI